MTQEIAERFLNLVAMGQNQPDEFAIADLDEIKLLYRYCKEQFPDEIEEILDRIDGRDDTLELEIAFGRILRLIEVGRTLPPKGVADSIDLTNDAIYPSFSLVERDKIRIAELCSQMRKIVFATTDFDQPHKVRLLNRIAAIEAESQKKKGFFDVVRGGLNDLGETLGKFGRDIKPLTDRMNEVVSIARSNTKEYDQLPAPEEVLKLPAPDQDEADK